MDWRPFSGSSTSYPTSERNCQSGGTLPVPTNAGSNVPKVRQGEHDFSHDGPQQEEKRHSQVHGSSQQDCQGHHGQTGVLEPVHQYRGSRFIRPKRGKQASPMRTRLIVVVNPIMPRSLKPNNRESRTSPRDEQNCCGCFYGPLRSRWRTTDLHEVRERIP